MASNITSNSKTALANVCGIIVERIYAAIAFQLQVDQGKALATIYGQPNSGLLNFTSAAFDYRSRLAEIKSDGERMLRPILVSMANECASRSVDGPEITDYARLFRDVSADLLGGTPDYVAKRGVLFASDPATSATGIFRRLKVDHQGEPIDDGWHGGTKKARIKGKPARYESDAVIEGPPNYYNDSIAYRSGRTRTLNGYIAVNDTQSPSGVFNPYFTPNSLTHGDAVTSVANWTMTTSGSYVMLTETTTKWRGRTYSLKFRGASSSYVEFTQVIPAAVLADPYRPWDFGMPIHLESGWQGTIDITWGGKTQQFTHSDLTAGSFKHLFLDLDKDLFPVNFDATGASYTIRFTNTTNNSSNAIYIAGFLPYAMLNYEGVWHSHYSDNNEPTVESTVSWADVMIPSGDINDALSFVYHDLAPGWAHLPSSGTATIADVTYAPEIQMYRNQGALASGATVALGSVASGAHVVYVQITNTGTGALAVATPTNGTDTNISTVTFSATTPFIVQPGESYTLTITVTDAGAGAFSTTITMLNNDASEGTTKLVISGTAT